MFGVMIQNLVNMDFLTFFFGRKTYLCPLKKNNNKFFIWKIKKTQE